jgi:hypothetical protein
MNSRKAKTIVHSQLMGIMLLAGLSTAGNSWAATSTAEAFASCQSQAEVAYGSADQLAEVRLDGVRKSGKQLRLKVFTPAGEQLNALCNVNRKSGQVVSIDPPAGKAAAEQIPASD